MPSMCKDLGSIVRTKMVGVKRRKTKKRKEGRKVGRWTGRRALAYWLFISMISQGI